VLAQSRRRLRQDASGALEVDRAAGREDRADTGLIDRHEHRVRRRALRIPSDELGDGLIARPSHAVRLEDARHVIEGTGGDPRPDRVGDLPSRPKAVALCCQVEAESRPEASIASPICIASQIDRHCFPVKPTIITRWPSAQTKSRPNAPNSSLP